MGLVHVSWELPDVENEPVENLFFDLIDLRTALRRGYADVIAEMPNSVYAALPNNVLSEAIVWVKKTEVLVNRALRCERVAPNVGNYALEKAYGAVLDMKYFFEYEDPRGTLQLPHSWCSALEALIAAVEAGHRRTVKAFKFQQTRAFF